MNDDLKDVREETHFKITFSDPAELKKFTDWCLEHGGIYDYDKEKSCQNGKQPNLEIFQDEICWCDIIAYYLSHVANYRFHDTVSPYKGEIYIRD